MIDPPAGAPELLAPVPGVRTFTQARRPGFADCAPSGRTRLDALAGWLQDVAYADVDDAGLAGAAVWVVRRTRICVKRFPRFGESYELITFCSGLGRMWAERRTDLVRPDAEPAGLVEPADVRAVSLWVHLDAQRLRPAPLTAAEIATYGGAPTQRRVSARLRHPVPPASGAAARRWTFRATECDLADHINNAAYWQPLEEELLAGADPERIDVELEFRAPAQPGEKQVLTSGDRRWIVGAGGELHATMAIRSGSDG